MSKNSEKAFKAAEAEIARVNATGGTTLDLGGYGPLGDLARDLETLPPSIADLDRVTRLSLWATQVSDLGPIAGMVGMTRLDLSNTQVSDLGPIAGLVGMTSLDLSFTLVSDLGPIAGMLGMTSLMLSHTRVSDLGHIMGMVGMKSLQLWGTQVSDLRQVAGMVGMTSLRLSYTQVSDLGPIAGMAGIKFLDLTGTQVSDLRPIAGIMGIADLDLSHTRVADLRPISGLAKMQRLDLSYSNVSDLGPIKGMVMLTHLGLVETRVNDLGPIAALGDIADLDLSSSQVSDLRPIAGMAGLAERPELIGLRFENTPATRNDPVLRDMAAIKDNAARGRAVLEYLAAKDGSANAPEPEPLLATVLLDGKFDLAPDRPTEAEARDRIKRVIHDRLRQHATELAQLAGNRWPKVASKARVLATVVDRPFEDLDMLSVHLEVDDLLARQDLGQEDGEPFSAEVLAALGNVTREGPGLTLDHAEVNLFIDRVQRARQDPVAPDAEAAHDALSRAIIAAPEAHGERSIAIETLAMETIDKAEKQAVQRAKHFNLLNWLGSNVLTLPAAAVGVVATTTLVGVTDNLLVPPATEFLRQNGPILMDAALTYGLPMSGWFLAVTAPVFAALGLEEEVAKRVAKTKPMKPDRPSGGEP